MLRIDDETLPKKSLEDVTALTHTFFSLTLQFQNILFFSYEDRQICKDLMSTLVSMFKRNYSREKEAISKNLLMCQIEIFIKNIFPEELVKILKN